MKRKKGVSGDDEFTSLPDDALAGYGDTEDEELLDGDELDEEDDEFDDDEEDFEDDFDEDGYEDEDEDLDDLEDEEDEG
jgi:hypothetical protein